MRPRSRKVFGAVSLAAGAALVFFEARRSLALGRVESWFWLLVGAAVIVLAMVEFLPGRSPHDRDD